MTINIDQYTESELIDLNRRIVERLRFMQQVRAHAAMLEFGVGDRVCFDNDDGQEVIGIITRYNKKTVSLVTEDKHRWRVSPSLLRKVEDITVTMHDVQAPKQLPHGD